MMDGRRCNCLGIKQKEALTIEGSRFEANYGRRLGEAPRE